MSQPKAVETSREAFEKYMVRERNWDQKHGFRLGKDGTYWFRDVQVSWEVWQAALCEERKRNRNLLGEALLPLAALIISGECTNAKSALCEEIKQQIITAHDALLAELEGTAQARLSPEAIPEPANRCAHCTCSCANCSKCGLVLKESR